MGKVLPPWCKRARKALIDKDMNFGDLATTTGYTRDYVSALLNGRQYGEEAVSKISGILGIKPPKNSMYL